jgi:hypothetical protein
LGVSSREAVHLLTKVYCGNKQHQQSMPPARPGVTDELTSYPELLALQAEMQARLAELQPSVPPHSPPAKPPRTGVLVVPPKTDTHTDFLLKEMQWLATDFMVERKRHAAQSRKRGASAQQHLQHAEARRHRDRQAQVLRNRKTARSVAGKCRQWWSKLNKVLAYQQKCTMEAARNQAMNEQLVLLVQQTERYTESLSYHHDHRPHNENGSSISSSHDQHRLTIEQALASGLETRRSKQRITDYARLKSSLGPAVFYGESTEESSSDESYIADHHMQEEDDETTLVQAEVEEIRERLGRAAADEAASFVVDPEELRKLHEEAEMDLEVFLERLNAERNGNVEESQQETGRSRQRRRVQFTNVAQDPGNDADDDGDTSDVEDFVQDEEFVMDKDEVVVHDETALELEKQLPQEMSTKEEIGLLETPVEEWRPKYAAVVMGAESDRSPSGEQDSPDNEIADEPFEPEVGGDVDDETTMEAEDSLGRDMSYQEEIDLLQKESEIPIEQLRVMYFPALGEVPEADQDMENSDDCDDQDEGNSHVANYLSRDDNDSSEQEAYSPDEQEEVDDETTMAAEEMLAQDMTYEDEISLLKREGEMSIEELKAMYANVDSADESEDFNEHASFVAEMDDAVENEENDEEFHPQGEEQDDETTLEQEERLGREMTVEDEISLLKEEAGLSIEDLRAKYKGLEGFGDRRSPLKRKRDVRTTRQATLDSTEALLDAGISAREALEALEASAEKARMTLASRPFLLAQWVLLREYQQTGLNWLVSLQSRRLNGILADGKQCLLE